MLVVNEDAKKASEWFTVCGVLISPQVSRCYRTDSSPKWTDRGLQTDIDQTLSTHLRESIQNVVR